MYFLGVAVILYVCYVCYKRWMMIPDYPAFGEDSDNSQDLTSKITEYRVYYMNKENRCYSTDSRDDFISMVFDLSKDNSDLLYEVDYLQEDEEFICISRDLEIINLLPYEKVNKIIFAKSPTKAIFRLEDSKAVDVTDIINKIIGPNYNFHNDITNILMDDLLVYVKNINLINNDNFTLEIDDNIGDKHKFNIGDTLLWSPSLINNKKIV